MNEQDRKEVDIAKAWISKYYLNKEPGANIRRLIEIIDRLDKQLAEIMEAGQFLDELVRLADKAEKADDDNWLMDGYGGRISEVEIGQIRRLAEKLNEVHGDEV